jgi:hypothetical protein
LIAADFLALTKTKVAPFLPSAPYGKNIAAWVGATLDDAGHRSPFFGIIQRKGPEIGA